MNLWQSLKLILVLLLSASGCQKSHKPLFTAYQKVFSFEVGSVTQLEIMKNDPETDDQANARWSARFEKQDSVWKIKSASTTEGPVYWSDTFAAGSLIDHLLDSLTSMNVSSGPLNERVGAKIESCDTACRQHFGLTPPVFAIRWAVKSPVKTASVSDTGIIFEFHLGAETKSNRLANSRFGMVSLVGGKMTQEVYQFDGAALSILQHFNSLRSIRMPTLSILDSREVDEIEVTQKGISHFYAQRDGSIWADRKHKKLSQQPVEQLLDQLTHLRVMDFMDDVKWTPRMASIFNTRLIFQTTLTNYKGQRFQFNFSKLLDTSTAETQILATSTYRPGSVFRIYPNTVEYLKPFLKGRQIIFN